MSFFLGRIRVGGGKEYRASALDKNRSEQASREDAVHSAHTCVFIDGALIYRLHEKCWKASTIASCLWSPTWLTRNAEIFHWQIWLPSSWGDNFFNIAGIYFFHAIFTLKININVLIFYVSTSNKHRGANEWLPMHQLLACIPRGPINWKCWILAFWLCRFLGCSCRVFLDVSV